MVSLVSASSLGKKNHCSAIVIHTRHTGRVSSAGFAQMAACHKGRQERIKSAAWQGWRRAVEHQKERAALVDACREAHCRRVLAASLAALQQAADFGKAADEYASRFSQQRQRRESIALQGLGERLRVDIIYFCFSLTALDGDACA